MSNGLVCARAFCFLLIVDGDRQPSTGVSLGGDFFRGRSGNKPSLSWFYVDSCCYSCFVHTWYLVKQVYRAFFAVCCLHINGRQTFDLYIKSTHGQHASCRASAYRRPRRYHVDPCSWGREVVRGVIRSSPKLEKVLSFFFHTEHNRLGPADDHRYVRKYKKRFGICVENAEIYEVFETP